MILAAEFLAIPLSAVNIASERRCAILVHSERGYRKLCSVHIQRVFLCIFDMKKGIWYISKLAWIHIWYVSKPVPPCHGTPLMIILRYTHALVAISMGWDSIQKPLEPGKTKKKIPNTSQNPTLWVGPPPKNTQKNQNNYRNMTIILPFFCIFFEFWGPTWSMGFCSVFDFLVTWQLRCSNSWID